MSTDIFVSRNVSWDKSGISEMNKSIYIMLTNDFLYNCFFPFMVSEAMNTLTVFALDIFPKIPLFSITEGTS